MENLNFCKVYNSDRTSYVLELYFYGFPTAPLGRRHRTFQVALNLIA
jgi:hypothetical protein